MSEPRLGIPARISFNHPYGRDLEPRRVEHLQFGITWDVTEILDHWQHPGRAEGTLGKPVLIRWWLLRVSGPLPAARLAVPNDTPPRYGWGVVVSEG